MCIYIKILLLLLFNGSIIWSHGQDFVTDLSKASRYLNGAQSGNLFLNCTYHFYKNDSSAFVKGQYVVLNKKNNRFSKSFNDLTLKTKTGIIHADYDQQLIYLIKNEKEKREVATNKPKNVDTTGYSEVIDSLKRIYSELYSYKGTINGLKKYTILSSYFNQGSNYDSTSYYFDSELRLIKTEMYIKQSIGEGRVKVTTEYTYQFSHEFKNYLNEEYFVSFNRRTRSYEVSENFKNYKIVYIDGKP